MIDANNARQNVLDFIMTQISTAMNQGRYSIILTELSENHKQVLTAAGYSISDSGKFKNPIKISWI